MLSHSLNNMSNESKIVFMGDSDVGKTTIVQRCLSIGVMDQPTIGVAFYRKVVQILNKDIILNIWDTSGQERYNSLSKTYTRGAICAVVVFDVTNLQSFESLKMWKNTIDNFHIPHCIIIGNKTDKNKHLITEVDIKHWCLENGADAYFLGSALNNEGIKELVENLAIMVAGSNTDSQSYGTMNNKSFKLEADKQKVDSCNC